MTTTQIAKPRQFTSRDFDTVNDGKILPQWYFTNLIVLFNQLSGFLKQPKWPAAKAAAIIAGKKPLGTSDGTLEILGDINIPLSARDIREVICIRNIQEAEKMILDNAQAHDKDMASSQEWVSFAMNLGITPGWYQFAIDEGLLLSIEESKAPLDPIDNASIENVLSLPVEEPGNLFASINALQNVPAAVVKTVPDKSPSGDAIPGKMPRTIIGKLAVKAAWQIEQATSKRATARQVIEKLQSWVDHTNNPDAVAELTEKIPSGVKWVTGKGKANNYDIGACEKALAIWNKSRV